MEMEPGTERRNIDVAMLNQELMLGLVRQHRLTEDAVLLNAELQNEIAARKKAEDALIRAEKLASVGRMAAVLAHEINNPLEAVTNVLYLAQTTEGLPEAARAYLAIADSELRRIAHITRQTLGFYRESSSPATFPIASLFDDICDLLSARVASRRAVVRRQCDPHIKITAFQGELRQVLANLFLNSLDAVAQGGEVTLRARSAPGLKGGTARIRITVADNGQGIPDAVRPMIFDPFFTTKGSVGNGLGLWVSKEIVEKHSGSLRFRSHTAGPCTGTVFTVLLPGGEPQVSAR